MSCLLVATDLSERSDRAVRRALRLGKLLDCRVRVLSVVDGDVPEALLDRFRETTWEQLDRFVAAEAADAEMVQTEVRTGDVAVAVPAAAEECDASLVLLGLHRPRPILDQLRETTMERLVRATARPVLLVRDAADHAYERALVPISFSPACAQAVQTAHRICPRGELHLFHAIHLPFSGLTGEGPGGAMARAVQREVEALRDGWLALYPLPEGVDPPEMVTGSVAETLDARMQGFQPHLLALGAHTRAHLSLYTLGSFAAELVRRPPCDLLLARPVA